MIPPPAREFRFGRIVLGERALGAGLFLGFVAVAIRLHSDFGMSWDEPVQARYGANALEYFLTGFGNDQAQWSGNLVYYNPLYEMACAVATQENCYEPWAYNVRHLLNSLTAIGAAFFAWRLARRRWGLECAALAAPLLLAMPHFFGHGFVNSKDIPFAAAFTLLLLVVERMAARRRVDWRLALRFGGAMGLVAAVRPAGLPLAIAVALAAICAPRALAALRGKLAARQGAGLWLKLLAAALLAWVIMVLPWPWAHVMPIARPIEAIRVAAKFIFPYPVEFEGVAYAPKDLPFAYLFKMLWFTLPPPILFAALAGLAVCAARLIRRGPRPALSLETTLCAAILVPLAMIVILRPIVYDGARHFLFLMPAVAILAARGAQALAGLVPRPRRALAYAALLPILFLPPLSAIVRLHPYQMTYYNLFAGGLRGANGNYELDYWLLSYREAAEWINDVARRAPPGRPPTVLVAANEQSFPCFRTYLDPSVRAYYTFGQNRAPEIPEGFDLYVSMTRWKFHESFPQSPVVRVVGREGGVFTVIKASRAFAAEAKLSGG